MPCMYTLGPVAATCATKSLHTKPKEIPAHNGTSSCRMLIFTILTFISVDALIYSHTVKSLSAHKSAWCLPTSSKSEAPTAGSDTMKA